MRMGKEWSSLEEARPAKVKYIGEGEEDLTHGKIYDAFFVEYWEGERNSLHVRDDSGEITDFHPLEDFEILEDPDNMLTMDEAIVECITHAFDDDFLSLTYGEQYKAIGRDKDGFYLVMDDSACCYFYSPDDFRIIEDKNGILQRESVYYCFGPSID